MNITLAQPEQAPPVLDLSQAVEICETHNLPLDTVLSDLEDPAPLSDGSEEHSYTANNTLLLPDQPEHWSKSLERKFDELLIRVTTKKITPEEQDDLARLRVLRRTLHHPRSGDEIMQEYERNRIIKDMVRSLNVYVRFNQTSRFARRSSTH